MEKENVKEIIAKNLANLRKEHKMTQQALAEKLNYSDKAISRWEHAETLPDIETLCKVCEIYGVRFEYLLQKEQPVGKSNPYRKQKDTFSKLTITLIAMCTVWLIATVAYTSIELAYSRSAWTLFIWAIPLTAIVGLFCSVIFGGGKAISIIASSIINWSLILSLFMEILINGTNLWILFIVGIPVQLIILFTITLKKKTRNK